MKHEQLLSGLDVFDSTETSDKLLSGSMEGFYQIPDTVLNRTISELELNNDDLSKDELVRNLAKYNAMCQQKNSKNVPGVTLYVKTVDKVHYRVYIATNNWISSAYYQNKLCALLTHLKPEQSCTLYLGSGVGHWSDLPTFGAVITHMQECQGTVRTICAGKCASPETLLWLYGKEREISIYGSLQFVGIKRILEFRPSAAGYFDAVYSRAVEIGILTEDEKQKLMTSNHIIFKDPTWVSNQ